MLLKSIRHFLNAETSRFLQNDLKLFIDCEDPSQELWVWYSVASFSPSFMMVLVASSAERKPGSAGVTRVWLIEAMIENDGAKGYSVFIYLAYWRTNQAIDTLDPNTSDLSIKVQKEVHKHF